MSHLSEIQLFSGPKIYRNFQNFVALADNIDRKTVYLEKEEKKNIVKIINR